MISWGPASVNEKSQAIALNDSLHLSFVIYGPFPTRLYSPRFYLPRQNRPRKVHCPPFSPSVNSPPAPLLVLSPPDPPRWALTGLQSLYPSTSLPGEAPPLERRYLSETQSFSHLRTNGFGQNRPGRCPGSAAERRGGVRRLHAGLPGHGHRHRQAHSGGNGRRTPPYAGCGRPLGKLLRGPVRPGRRAGGGRYFGPGKTAHRSRGNGALH